MKVRNALVLGIVLLAAPTSVIVAGQFAPAYAACAQEDGSTPGQAFPCEWRADEMGNGHGDSYVLRDPAAIGK